MPIIDGQEKQPIVAICYDFDKTLSPDDMQAQGFIQSVGYDVAKFWEETGKLARENNMDSNLAYMYKMVQEAKGNLVFSRAALEEYGSRVKLFDGVNGWFERLREYGLRHGVKVEHYIISSGLKEMIEGTRIAREGALREYMRAAFILMSTEWLNGRHRSSIIPTRHSIFSGYPRGFLTSTMQV